MPPKYNGRGGGMQQGGYNQVGGNNGGGNGAKRMDHQQVGNSYGGGGGGMSAQQVQAALANHQQQQMAAAAAQQQQMAAQQQAMQQQQQQQHAHHQQQQQQMAAQQQQGSMMPGGVSSTTAGTSACGDSFGMLGLVSDSKSDNATAETQNKSYLVRGFDLGQLGLSLVDSSHLYPTFASPWHDQHTLLVPEFRVPPCYKVEVGRITYNTFQKFSEPTCFYVFYSMPKDLLQVAAAKELVTRGYVYHMTLKQWLKIDPKGTSTAFNPDKWAHEPLSPQFVIREEDLMRTIPTAPVAGSSNAAAGSNSAAATASA